MFEEKLISILGEKRPLKDFHILTHEKHRREVYFERENKNALSFMKIKFKSPKKRLIYFLIRLGILTPFLKKINFPSKTGQLIFVAEQIKIFDFTKRIVTSYPGKGFSKENFIKSKQIQSKATINNFAPKILKLNEKIPYSVEELVVSPKKIDNQVVFKRLLEYYQTQNIQKMKSDVYVEILKYKLEDKITLDRFFLELFDILQDHKTFLMFVDSHGDFAPGQILKRGDKIVFTDWNSSKELITYDLSNYFRFVEDILGGEEIRSIIKLYPKPVQEDICYHLILNELSQIIKNPSYEEYAKKRIKCLLVWV